MLNLVTYVLVIEDVQRDFLSTVSRRSAIKIDFMKIYVSILFFSFLIFQSCNSDTLSNECKNRSFSLDLEFHDAEHWGEKPANNNIQLANIVITSLNCQLTIESDDVEVVDVLIDGGQMSKLMRIKKLPTNKKSIFSTGYLLYPDGCFHYSLYVEGDNGNILVVEVCTNFNCIGFEPICAGDGESWA